MFDITGKVVVIAGGAGLLGAEFVSQIANAGATAIIAEPNLEKFDGTVNKKTLQNQNGTIGYVQLDITSADSLSNSIDVVSNNYGQIDCFINSAYPRNARYGKPFFEVTYDDFCENVGLGLGGYFLASQIYSSYFKELGRGNIINISSIYGVIAPRFNLYTNTEMTMPVEYAATKSALIHLTKYIAQYLKNTGVRINSISPGGINDGQNPAFIDRYNAFCSSKGMLAGVDIAGTLIYLISDASAYVTGQNLVVDDGFTL